MNAFDFKDLMKHSVMNDSIDKVNVTLWELYAKS